MRNARGFSLIEVIIVVIVVSLAAAAFARAFSELGTAQNWDEKIQVGGQLAQAKTEQILADKRNPSRGFTYITSTNYPTESTVANFTSYSRSVTIANVSTNPPCTTNTTGTCLQVTVTVTNGSSTVGTSSFMVVDY